MARRSQPAVFSAKTTVSWQGALSYMHPCSAPSLLCPKTSLSHSVWLGGAGRQGTGECWQSLSQDLPRLPWEIFLQTVPCSAVGLCCSSVVVDFLLFEHNILVGILPSCWVLHLVLLALVLCYHQFNTSCVTLKEERQYVIRVFFFHFSSDVKRKVTSGHLSGVPCDTHQFM